MGTLYLVSIPTSNLEDVTLRALRILGDVSAIAADELRLIHRFLARHDITAPCLAYNEQTKHTQIDELLTELAMGDVALVSASGTPGFDAAGQELINTCLAAGFEVVPVPGPHSAIAVLSVSGLSNEPAVHLGMLPRRAPDRRTLLYAVADQPFTIVCSEAAHRFVESLEDMLSVFGDRRVVIARELGKPQEQFRREMLSQSLSYFSSHRPHGDMTIAIVGRSGSSRGRSKAQSPSKSTVPPLSTTSDSTPAVDDTEIVERLLDLRTQGLSGSAAARQVSREFGLNKNVVYQLWLSLDEAPAADDAE
jgi:16S rRNA (cytidine1402-2'-O)-methyltransferase